MRKSKGGTYLPGIPYPLFFLDARRAGGKKLGIGRLFLFDLTFFLGGWRTSIARQMEIFGGICLELPYLV